MFRLVGRRNDMLIKQIENLLTVTHDLGEIHVEHFSMFSHDISCASTVKITPALIPQIYQLSPCQLRDGVIIQIYSASLGPDSYTAW